MHLDPKDYCKYNKWDKKCNDGGPGQGQDCKKYFDKCLGLGPAKWPDNHCKDNKWSKDKECKPDKGDWCKWHKCNHESHKNHRHNHNNDKHYYNHDTNIYYYYYTNDYSNNHATVILQPDYSHSKNYDKIRLVIGDDNGFDTIINFAGKPENLVITGLDIDEGEQFDVCMKNEHDGKTNCVTATLKDEDKAVYVDIRVP